MLKKFALFFIIFGLSYLVQEFGWTDQGSAFVLIDLGGSVLILGIVALAMLIAGNGLGEKLGVSFVILLAAAVLILIHLFATIGATKLFDINFETAYQVMAFGRCLVMDSKAKNNN
ncbi:MAG: hypothetical protein LBL91_02490 [Lachnospiraceae bacterium]|jgi:hypothetical protein|nr:hypothetical protein [Lachnospiraceae bacterium]